MIKCKILKDAQRDTGKQVERGRAGRREEEIDQD